MHLPKRNDFEPEGVETIQCFLKYGKLICCLLAIGGEKNIDSELCSQSPINMIPCFRSSLFIKLRGVFGVHFSQKNRGSSELTFV